MVTHVGLVLCVIFAGMAIICGQNVQSDDNMIMVSAGWLCEGLECPAGSECTLEQGKCTAQDCSLKPSCTPRLPKCKGCRRGCAHAVLNRDATIGCHPCLCEISVHRSLVEQLKGRSLETTKAVVEDKTPEQVPEGPEDVPSEGSSQEAAVEERQKEKPEVPQEVPKELPQEVPEETTKGVPHDPTQETPQERDEEVPSVILVYETVLA